MHWIAKDGDMRIRALVVSVVGSAALLTGCASIINGSMQEIALTSEPSEADVMIDGRHRGKTPLSVSLKREERHTVSISLPGYRTREIALERRISGWVWGNILLGGLIGLVVDSSTGAMYRIDPDTLRAQLRPDQIEAQDGELQLHVLVRERIPQDWERVGQLQRHSWPDPH